MASISAPCPKCSAVTPRGSRNGNLKQQSVSLSSSNPAFLAGSARLTRLQGPKRIQFPILRAQVREVSTDRILTVLKFFLSCASVLLLKPMFHLKTSTDDSSNASPLSSTKLEIPSSDGKDPKVEDGAAHQSALPESTISAFMAEVSDLVKLVNSRDIMELKLKQMDCELIIKKKEAFVQSAPTAPAVMMQHHHQPMLPPQPPMTQPAPSAPPPSASAPAPAPLPPSKGSKSLLAPLKCPMAGTFYRCPGPGEPPFIKVGDKVQKGQVVCIIEAMKLMNEIEADQSGTVVEILAEDGKLVSIDMPLLVIQP